MPFTTNIFPDFGSTVYDTLKRKDIEKVRQTYTPTEVHNARASILESQLNQMERRLRMAETEARLAKGRERRILSILIERFNNNAAFRHITSRELTCLLEEVNYGDQETSEP